MIEVEAGLPVSVLQALNAFHLGNTGYLLEIF